MFEGVCDGRLPDVYSAERIQCMIDRWGVPTGAERRGPAVLVPLASVRHPRIFQPVRCTTQMECAQRKIK